MRAWGTIIVAAGACFASCGSEETGVRPGAAGSGGSGGSGATGGATGMMPPISPTGGGPIGGGGGPSDGGVMGCAVASVKSELVPANILVVLDRSGSMNCNLPPITESAACEKNPVQADPTQPTKWAVVKKALKDAVAALPPTASVGISYFNTDDECGANSAPSVGVKVLSPAQIDALGTNLDVAKAPQGGTPIVGATVLAFKHLHQQSQVSGNKFVLLITDGAETCDADKIGQLATEIPKATTVNIRTFVIGAPGSEPARGMLSEMAFLGGTAQSSACQHGGLNAATGDCHFDMTTSKDFGADLAVALKRISGSLTCSFDLPVSQSGPIDLTRVNVRFTKGSGTGLDIPQDTSGPCQAGAQGWQYSSDKTGILLCGNICDEVRNDATGRIDIVLGCTTVVK
jgi:von Willebrand factor type A domain